MIKLLQQLYQSNQISEEVYQLLIDKHYNN